MQKWLVDYVKVLGHHLGATWTSAWIAAGFPNGSTAIPDTTDGRMGLLPTVKSYLTANAGHQSADFDVTPAQAQVLFDAASLARDEYNSANTAAENAKTARGTAEKKLRRCVRCLEAELGLLVEDDDPVYHAFGLSAPDDPETPEVPEAPTVTLGMAGSNSFTLAWPHALRADRYRVWALVQGGTETEPLLIVSEEQVTIANYTTGTVLEISLSAMNEAGESPRSPAVPVAVP